MWGLQDVPEHPTPTADELFTQLKGGEKFKKVDFSSGYQEVLLDEESRQYVIINTQLGLYHYTRLHFGVASCPAIFQNIVDSFMSGLQGIDGILDDLIITGSKDERHLSNLGSALERMSGKRIEHRRRSVSL